ncbi:MAG: FAD-binding protein [Turicibacter sp.]|nr:FAD-binding protein [Turicibacter sp.]
MKRLLTIFLIALGFTSVLVLAGCTDDTAEPDEPDTEEPTEMAETPGETEDAYFADIVVIGGGAAGMTAAAQAVYDGATNVIILEQAPFTGGIALQAFGGINAAESRYQVETGEYSTVEEMIDWIMNPGVTHPELVRTMVEHSADTIHWFNDFAGAGFNVLMGNWAHRPDVGEMSPDNSDVGTVLVDSLNQTLVDHNIPVLLNTTATEILVDETGAVIGVVATRAGEEITINTHAVVVTTGAAAIPQTTMIGFDADAPGYGVALTPEAENTGWQLAYNAGAELTITLRALAATGVPNVNYSIDLFEQGATLVNIEGDTFIDVLDATDQEIALAVQQQPEARFFVVFNEEIADEVESFEIYQGFEDFLIAADTIEELAELLEIDADALADSIDFDGPFYAGPGTGMAVGASAGIRINVNAEVVGRNGGIVTGLYAAGPSVGGIQGWGRHGGSSLMEVMVFGRIAGASAAQFISNNFEHTALTMPHSDTLIFAEELAAQDAEVLILGSLADLEDGVFEGSAEGYLGTIYVEVTVEGGSITAVEITNHNDTDLYMMMAEDGVIPQIIAGAEEVDATAGATYSSSGIVEAVRDALGL